MLNLILMLGMLVQDGSFVVTDRPASQFVVTDRALAAKRPEAGPVVIPETGLKDAKAKPEPTHYVYFFTADWCGVCKQYKAAGKLQQIKDAVPVKEIDVENAENSKWRSQVTRYPSMWVVSADEKQILWRSSGTMDPASVIDAYKKNAPSKAAKPPARQPELYGSKGTSHESRETLIQHLLRDGIHRERHTMEELNAMSDRELVNLHDQEHEENGDAVVNGLWRQKK